MGDMGDYWRDVNDARQEKRELNRQFGTKALEDAGIKFDIGNPWHLIISTEPKIDYWPSTGKFRQRGSGKKGRGIKPLMSFIYNQAERVK